MTPSFFTFPGGGFITPYFDDARVAAFAGAFREDLPTGASVLEIGAGTGVLSFLASQYARRVVAVENDPDLVSVMRNIAKTGDPARRPEDRPGGRPRIL